MSIKDNIKKLRDIHGLTQQDLADIAGVTNKAVSAWESGLSEPRMGAIERMARRYGIKKSNLIEDDGMEKLHLDESSTATQHDTEEWSEEELESIKQYKQFLKSQRKV